MLNPYSAVPTKKNTHAKAYIDKTKILSIFDMQFPLSELRRSASARMNGNITEGRGQTMSLYRLKGGLCLHH